VLCSNVPVGQSVSFLTGNLQNLFRVSAQWQFHRGGDAFALSNNFGDFITNFQGEIQAELTH
jgi:hypothetical protein